MPESKRLLSIMYAAILSVLAAMVTAMLSKEPNIWTKCRTFIAGVSAGVLCHMILMNFNLSQGIKEIICSGMAAFAATVWPLLGKQYTRYVKKKTDDSE